MWISDCNFIILFRIYKLKLMFKLSVKSEFLNSLQHFSKRRSMKSYGWISSVVQFDIFSSSNVVSSDIASIIRHFRSMNQMRRLFTVRYVREKQLLSIKSSYLISKHSKISLTLSFLLARNWLSNTFYELWPSIAMLCKKKTNFNWGNYFV